MKYTSNDSPFFLSTILAGIGAIVSLVLLIVVDVLGLLVNQRDPGQPTFFSIVLALVFLGSAGITWRALSKSDPGLSPYERLISAGRFVSIVSFGLVVSSFFLPDDLGHPWGVMGFILAYPFAAAAVILLIRQLYWVDTLVLLRRTSYTSRVRKYVLPVMALLVLLGILWPGSSTLQITVVSVAGGLLFFLFGAISGVSWIIALTRKQKWRAFGLACLASINGWVLFGIVIGSNAVQAALRAFIPGVDYVVALVVICSTMVFGRLAFSLLLTLPSAGIIDRQVSEKNSLSIMGSILTGVEDLDNLIGRVLAVVTGVHNRSVAWIELAADGDGVPFAAHRGLTEPHFELVQHQSSLSAIAAPLRQPLYIEHLAEHPGLKDLYMQAHGFLQSLIIVPIELDSRRLGTLYVGHPQAFTFERESLMLFSSIAGTTSLAVQNNRLFDRLLRRERYERELFLAREIQQKLLPRNYTVPDGFEVAGYTSPAFEVGGDYYDVVTLKNNRCCLLIGDVSGKGMSAAMYTAELKGVVLAAASESNSPSELLCRINRAMYGSLDRQIFITLGAMEIDSESNTVRLARAGHNPFLIRSRSGTMFVAPKGIGVGLVGSAVFDKALEMREVELVPGDVCVMYTDGINEAINEEQVEYGNERLEQIIGQTRQESSADFILGAIVRDAAEFGGGAPQHDDMTLLVVNRTGYGKLSEQYQEREVANAL